MLLHLTESAIDRDVLCTEYWPWFFCSRFLKRKCKLFTNRKQLAQVEFFLLPFLCSGDNPTKGEALKSDSSTESFRVVSKFFINWSWTWVSSNIDAIFSDMYFRCWISLSLSCFSASAIDGLGPPFMNSAKLVKKLLEFSVFVWSSVCLLLRFFSFWILFKTETINELIRFLNSSLKMLSTFFMFCDWLRLYPWLKAMDFKHGKRLSWANTLNTRNNINAFFGLPTSSLRNLVNTLLKSLE